MRAIYTLVILLILALILPGCSTGPLLADVALSKPELQPTGNGESINLSYSISRRARVSVFLQAANGQQYFLRNAEIRLPSSDAYSLRFDGTVPVGENLRERRLLSSGTYTIVVEATSDDGSNGRAEQALTISGSDVPTPQITDLLAFPETISPNADGIEDVSEITYQLPVSATVDITINGPGCQPLCPFVTADQQKPGPQRVIWNGRTVDGVLLPDGTYTYIVRAQDRYGNLVERAGALAIAGGGQPEARITYTYMAPQAIMLGDVITVTMRVENIGKVPIRTYGPPSGYEYNTDTVFSSIEGGQYVAKPGGFWRVGVDWDANSGGAAKRYPYRWAITPRPPDQWKVPYVEDLLMPGEEAVVVGRIRVRQPETKMGFYTGLIQDGVGFFQDRTGRTIIKVGF